MFDFPTPAALAVFCAEQLGLGARSTTPLVRLPSVSFTYRCCHIMDLDHAAWPCTTTALGYTDML